MIDAWSRYYPPDVFPTIWSHMNSAATSGMIFVIDEVVKELERKDDGIHQWVKKRPSMIVAIDADIQHCLSEIMTNYSRLVDSKKNRSVGDPWVVALARSRSWTVVTAERPSGKLDKPKIPDVCTDLKIPCLSVIEFFREQKWKL
jgi:hypothetical protein